MLIHIERYGSRCSRFENNHGPMYIGLETENEKLSYPIGQLIIMDVVC